MKTYETATIDELDARRTAGRRSGAQLDVQAFGVNAWTAAEAGGRLIPEHDEVPSGHEELYLVVAGRATFTVDGDEIDAPAGTVVFVRDPAAKRAAVAAEAGTTVLGRRRRGRARPTGRARGRRTSTHAAFGGAASSRRSSS